MLSDGWILFILLTGIVFADEFWLKAVLFFVLMFVLSPHDVASVLDQWSEFLMEASNAK